MLLGAATSARADLTIIDLLGHLRADPAASAPPAREIGPIEIGGRMRTAVMTSIPNVIEVPIVVPEGARLQVGLAMRESYLGKNIVAESSPTRFSGFLVLADGRREPLFERVVDIRNRVEDRRWIDVHVDLSRFAGMQASLRLRDEVLNEPRSFGKGFALWARPLVYVPAEQRTHPNLLLITIDALRADHLGSHGYGRATSPQLDRLAAEGVRFSAAFTSGPMTVPSLPQIFTSAYFPHGDSPNLLSSLFAGGVPRTKAILNNPYLQYWLTLNVRDGFDSMTAARWRADKITRAALKWLGAQPSGERFALYLHYLDTHTPYRTPAPHALAFGDPAYRGPVGATFGDVDGARRGQYDAPDRAQIVALYDGAIRFVDAEVGRLLDELRARGLLERTLVVVTADHGEELWDHGSFFHGQSLYDELLHVPLIVRLPDRAHAGRVVAEQVRAVDIVPTVTEVLGLPTFAAFEGRSLLARLTSRGAGPPELFARAANPEFPYRFALRTESHKLIVSVGTGQEELYDLRADPRETRDLARTPEAEPVLAPLRERLGRYRDRLEASGFQLRAVARDGTSHAVEVTITATDGSLADPDRIGLASGDRVDLSTDGRRLRWTGTVGGTPVGIRFEPGLAGPLRTNPRLEVRVQVEGRDVRPAAIRLARDGERPPSSPFTYRRIPATIFAPAEETPVLETTAPPHLVAADDEAVSFFLWRFPDGDSSTFVAPDLEALQRRLRALGYVQ